MLTLDTEAIKRHKRGARRESAVERRNRLLAENLKSNTVTVEPDGGRDVSDMIAQMGRIMPGFKVRELLKKCNARLIFRPSASFPERYYDVRILTKDRNPAGGWVDKETQVCGMEAGICPEFSVLHKTKIIVPNRDAFGKIDADGGDWIEVDTFADETRGWRTVLIRLLHAELITRGDVQKYFGWEPSRDSEKWQKSATR